MTNITILSIFRTHAQKEYRKVWEMKSTSILNILALYFLENYQCIYSKSGLIGTQYKAVKCGVGVESASFHGFVNDKSLLDAFPSLLCIYYCRTIPILKTYGQFENWAYVIISTKENIRLTLEILKLYQSYTRSHLMTTIHLYNFK